jgi:alkaline phosphatase
MNRRAFLIRFFIALITVTTLQLRILAVTPAPEDPKKVKYVFMFIGDGMGQAQVNLTQAYLAALENRVGFGELNFTQFPQAGFVSTFANNQMITCSAASGTALATGHKTNIGRISMDSSAAVRFPSIATMAKNAGYKVGIVTSVSIDHATPAVFYAHQPDRDMYYEIGVELAKSNFDFFAGGGFLNSKGIYEGKEIDVVKLARLNDFNIISNRSEFDELVPGNGKTLVLYPRLAGEASLPFSLDMGPEDITLDEYTSKAIRMLDNDMGFFLMVEGGKIDWACHGNDAAAAIHEVLAFDKAVGNAVEFYKQHPDETLIIVTADHETGGLALGNNKTGYNSYIGLLKYQKSSEEELNKIVASLRTSNSGDVEADFTKMMNIIENETGLNSAQHNTQLSEGEIFNLKKIFRESIYNKEQEKGTYGESEPFINAVLAILAEKAGISWGSGSHTFISVPIYSTGAGAERFSGYIDNTDIPKIIGELMGIVE